MNVVVVGAGILGASLARTLAQAGWEVTLVEQYEPGDPRAASVACSRILRFAHGADVRETSSAWRARGLWLELEHATGTSLFSQIGMAWLARSGASEWEESAQRVLTELGVPVERLSTREAAKRLPGLRADDLDFVLFEPHAGLLRPRVALRALVQDAIAAGAILVSGRAMPAGAAVALGERQLEGDRVVWACGAWTPGLFPELVRGTVIQQDVFYFSVPEPWASPPAPAWGEWQEGITGTGSFLGAGFKLGADRPGPPFDPDSGRREPLRGHERQARAYLARRFPTLEHAPLSRTETCQTVVLEPSLPEPTAWLGGEVRLLRHPDNEQVWLLGDGSGHAFKHATAIAVEVAELLV
jgi:sarcosine oxidase